jgi:drug/metabolite transporter (DMT)-like permease
VLPAFLTTVCFSVSIIFAARASRMLGGTVANLSRMIVALIALGSWAFLFGQGLRGPSLGWLLVSGAVGFGFGDLAMFTALPQLGPRLTVLLIQCLAAPFGALAEWAWLGTALRAPQILYSCVVIAGVALALAPDRRINFTKEALIRGTIFGTLAALGQGFGAVISRKAYEIARASAFTIDPGTAAFQRMVGGLTVVLLVIVTRRSWRPVAQRESVPRIAWLWTVLNGLAGPALGVGCYQWALFSTPSGVVLPIVATTPIAAIPLTYLIEGEIPAIRSVVGAIIAVAGAAALALA